MKNAIGCIFVLLFTFTALADKEKKPAWKWTLEERIAKRVDPADIRRRTLQKERDLVEKDGITPEIRISVGLPPHTEVKFVVEGRNDPELLLPWELSVASSTGHGREAVKALGTDTATPSANQAGAKSSSGRP